MRWSVISLLFSAILLAGCSSVVRENSPGLALEDASRDAAPPAGSGGSEPSAFLSEDDPLYQQLLQEIALAEEYYQFGIRANSSENWYEAQYNFERAISILSDLDIEPDEGSELGKRYSTLLEDIRSEYKLTLLYLATIPGETSSSAFVDRFIEISDFSMLRRDKVVTSVDLQEKYNIPIVVNDKVENCIVYFQTIARDFFQAALTRSGAYTKLMSEILEEEGVPTDLVYLPLIESGFKTNAYSWAKAMGPWQFISATGKRYGLERSWWYDERRDYAKSTRAAARYLRDLYNRYGDWYCALAGYNGGEGRVDREVKRIKSTDYWKMSKLARETRDYVPLYLAATIIAKNPEKYGFTPYYDEPLAFETITINKCLDLKDVASAIGSTTDYLLRLNPELLRKITPPGVDSYHLRIPVGTSERFWASYDSFSKPYAAGMEKHRIQRGETLSTIARKYGVSIETLAAANNISTRSPIYAGRDLMVPISTGAKQPRVASSTTAQRRVDSSDKYASLKAKNSRYKVKKGDSLWEIAEANNTTVNSLRILNNLGTYSQIYPGQVLKVNPGDASQTPSKVFTYKVKKGDTLEKIASRYGTTVRELALVNGINTIDYLRVGQLINVPSKQKGSQSSSGNILVYVVKAGDTLWGIAKAFGTTVEELVSLNQLSSRNLQVGDRLKVRKG